MTIMMSTSGTCALKKHSDCSYTTIHTSEDHGLRSYLQTNQNNRAAVFTPTPGGNLGILDAPKGGVEVNSCLGQKEYLQ